MGEKTYEVKGKLIRFSEDSDEFDCLCTFPHNDQETLEVGRVVALALFGAVVRLVFDGYYDNHEGGYIFIPQDVPDWIVEGVVSSFTDATVLE